MKTICERLVEFTQAIEFQELPSEVIREAGRRVLDALGCMTAGIQRSTSQQVRGAMMELGGIQESTILGTGDLTSCEKATLVNCTSLRFLDYMDGYLGSSPCHVCFNIPPILAVAERARANGRQLVTALVVAYEIMPRFLECTGLSRLSSRGWAGGINLEFSVPLAIAPLLGLETEQIVNALAISITHGNALDTSSGGQMPASKSIVDGMTAMNSVIATLLAKQGISGPHEAIEGPGGYTSSVAGTCDYDQLLAPVVRYKILDTSTKWHNTVKCARTAVPAALEIIRDHSLNWRDIASLQIGLTRRDWEHQAHDPSGGRTRPKTRDAANHSVRYGVAAALVDGELGPDQYEPEKLHSPQILDLIDRMSLYWEESHDAYWPSANPATIKIRTKEGQDLSRTVTFAPGHPKNPLPDEALEQKFRQLTRNTLDPGKMEGIIAATRNLADLPDARDLTRIIRPSVTR